MASIKLRGDTSGELVIEAPAVAGTNTLTLPAATANILTDTSSLPAANLTGSLPAGMGGKILQVVTQESNTQYSTTGATFIDFGVSATITPSSTSSKILVMGSINALVTANGRCNLKLLRDTTDIKTHYIVQYANASNSANNNSFMYMDTPSSTSALTYKLQFNRTNAGTVYMNYNDGAASGQASSFFTLMEVAG